MNGPVDLVEPWSLTCLRTAAWVGGVSACAALVALVAARGVRPVSVRWWILVIGAIVPPFTTWFAAWSWCAPDRVVGRWILGGGVMEPSGMREATLALVLVAWGGALATVIASAWDERRASDSLADMDGLGAWQRFLLEWRRRRGGIAAGTTAVALVLLGESTVFDLAQVRTIPFELRSVAALGATPGQLVALALPVLGTGAVLATFGAWVLVHREARGADRAEPEGRARDRARHRRGERMAAALLPIVVVALLASLLTLPWTLPRGERVRPEHVLGLGRSVLAAGAVGAALAAAAGATLLVLLRRRGGRLQRLVIAACTLVALLLAAVPPTLVAEAARALPGTWLPLVCAQCVRFSAVGWVAALLGAASAPADVSEAARLRGGLGSCWRGHRPLIARTALGVGVLATILAFSDVSLASQLEPIGADRLATRLVDALHYQRPGPVALILPGVGAAAVLAGLAGWIMRRHGGRGGRGGWSAAALACTATIATGMAAGCGSDGEGAQRREDGTGASAGVRVVQVIGSPGRSPGCFEYPRALDVSPLDGSVAVVDKTGRVQVFDADGRLSRWWRMPETDQGMPTGVTCGPDGSIWVADTHEHRVLQFARDGAVMRSIGRPGTGNGEFIYPTDVALRSDGRILVSEYGGNDRIQEFAPDGSFLRSFGMRGVITGDGAEAELQSGVVRLDRPQSMVLDEPSGRLFVADACHHRIVVLDLDGRFVGSIGEAGREADRLWYPYGLALLPSGSLIACEFGGNRLHRIDPGTGVVGATIGGGGRSPGQFATPWAVAVRGGQLVVCDSRNGRVQVVEP